MADERGGAQLRAAYGWAVPRLGQARGAQLRAEGLAFYDLAWTPDGTQVMRTACESEGENGGERLEGRSGSWPSRFQIWKRGGPDQTIRHASRCGSVTARTVTTVVANGAAFPCIRVPVRALVLVSCMPRPHGTSCH